MDGVQPIDDREQADFFFQGAPMRFTTARAYFMVKHLQQWGAWIRLHPWDSWEQLANRLERRLGQHLWHPEHWVEHPPRTL